MSVRKNTYINKIGFSFLLQATIQQKKNWMVDKLLRTLLILKSYIKPCIIFGYCINKKMKCLLTSRLHKEKKMIQFKRQKEKRIEHDDMMKNRMQ